MTCNESNNDEEDSHLHGTQRRFWEIEKEPQVRLVELFWATFAHSVNIPHILSTFHAFCQLSTSTKSASPGGGDGQTMDRRAVMRAVRPDRPACEPSDRLRSLLSK